MDINNIDIIRKISTEFIFINQTKISIQTDINEGQNEKEFITSRDISSLLLWLPLGSHIIYTFCMHMTLFH